MKGERTIMEKKIEKFNKPNIQHRLIELLKCDKNILSNIKKVESIMIKAARQCGAHVVSHSFHRISTGIIGSIIIKESHFIIHTWESYNYAVIDLMTCGKIDIDVAVKYLIKHFKSKGSSVYYSYTEVVKS